MPRNRAKNTTLLASMTTEGMGPCVAVVGSTTRVVFETFVERLLAPALSPGQVVVMDNLGAHKGERVRELIQEKGCELLVVYLPPYSPDLNPIEEAFSKVKGLLLRRAGARTREALIEAMGRALDVVTAEDARGFFEHCGYPIPAQHLYDSRFRPRNSRDGGTSTAKAGVESAVEPTAMIGETWEAWGCPGRVYQGGGAVNSFFPERVSVTEVA